MRIAKTTRKILQLNNELIPEMLKRAQNYELKTEEQIKRLEKITQGLLERGEKMKLALNGTGQDSVEEWEAFKKEAQIL